MLVKGQVDLDRRAKANNNKKDCGKLDKETDCLANYDNSHTTHEDSAHDSGGYSQKTDPSLQTGQWEEKRDGG